MAGETRDARGSPTWLLGGWLFADLVLGAFVIFLVSVPGFKLPAHAEIDDPPPLAAEVTVTPTPTPVPARFAGTVTIESQTAPDGATVAAFVGARRCGSANVVGGRYSLDVLPAAMQAGCGADGVPINFTIGALRASESGAFQAGDIALDLTAKNPADDVPPCPPRTAILKKTELTVANTRTPQGGLDIPTVEQLRAALEQFLGQKAGLVLTYVYSAQVATGTRLADTVNERLREALPEIFGADAIYESLNWQDANPATLGQVHLQLYFDNPPPPNCRP